MSHKGCCYDNAVAESFFHSLKGEWLRYSEDISADDMHTEVFRYIEAFYNTKRKHSTIDYLSPDQFEQRNQAA